MNPRTMSFVLEVGFFFFKFIYLWLCWVFVPLRGLSLVAASGDHSSSRCAGLSLSRPLLLRSTGSRRAGSVVVAHGPSRSAACGIFPDQGSNPCPLHWQADSQPLSHQGSPRGGLFITRKMVLTIHQNVKIKDIWFFKDICFSVQPNALHFQPTAGAVTAANSRCSQRRKHTWRASDWGSNYHVLGLGWVVSCTLQKPHTRNP